MQTTFYQTLKKEENLNLKLIKMTTIKFTFKINKARPQESIFYEVLSTTKKLDFDSLKTKYQVTKEKVTNDVYVVMVVDDFVKKFIDLEHKIISKQNQIYIYNGAFWETVKDETIKTALYGVAMMQGVPIHKAKHHSFRQELYKQVLITIVSLRFSKDEPVRINLQNGTMEFKGVNANMVEFNQDHFLKYQLSFGFDPIAKASIFQDYLDKVLPDKTVQMVLAEFIGSIFIKNGSGIKLEKALVLFGGGSNGKSVFFEIIQALLGSNNISNFSLGSLTDKTGYSRAQIEDKLLNFASEIDKKMNGALFKQLASNEPVEARHIYGRPHQIKNYAKLAFNTNVLPIPDDNTKAFFRRFIIIPFNVIISEEDQDKELHSKIIENELPGVFNWVIKGLKRVVENKGFTQSDIIDKQVRVYQTESDSVRLFILEKKHKKSLKFNYKLNKLFDEYKFFCIEGGYRSLNNMDFSKALKNIGFQIKRKNIGRFVNVNLED